MRKGIVLAGGRGTRLHPLTLAVSKQLLPVYDKPMIYYPLSVLMMGNIRDILIISTPQDLPSFRHLLGDGSQWGVNFSYAPQEVPGGLAQAFIVGKNFIGNDLSCLILGDNIFHGADLSRLMHEASSKQEGATVFAYPVSNPSRYGVIQFNEEGKAISIEEKPHFPKSRYAVPGLYFYDQKVIDIVSSMKPSGRGELEITDVNRIYMEREELEVKVMERGMAWLDAGTYDSLLESSLFIETIEKRQGLKISCPEEIAYRNGFIDAAQLQKLAEAMKTTSYGLYLQEILREAPMSKMRL